MEELVFSATDSEAERNRKAAVIIEAELTKFASALRAAGHPDWFIESQLPRLRAAGMRLWSDEWAHMAATAAHLSRLSSAGRVH
ncbi:hypothetical protein [Piscinibacter sp.]|uniref:hypothetical protein n=1 Tax=Piscinibacter sp. TaxID=1903157 RepID=UPI0039E36656